MLKSGSKFPVTPEMMGSIMRESTDEMREEDKFIDEATKRNGWNITESTQGLLHFLAGRRYEYSSEERNGNGNGSAEAMDLRVLSHLADTSEIMRLVPENMSLAAMVHDIGKSGPSDLDIDYPDDHDRPIMHKLVAAMFAAPFKIPKGETRTVGQLVDFLFDQRKENDDKIRLIWSRITKEKALELLTLIGVDPQANVLPGFFEKHIAWGKSNLDHEPNISDNMKYVALNHHDFLKDIHVDIEGFEPTDEHKKQAFFLEVVDYYQAARRRGQKDHITAETETRNRFEDRIEEKIARGDDFDPAQIKEWMHEIFDEIIASKQEAVFNT